MIDELMEEFHKGDTDEVKFITTALKENLAKINHHGKRASNIVRGMLDHSRARAEKPETTDLNSLLDEYLRLAYHGLRARDKSFNALFESHLDPDLPLVKVVKQDFGRVILNLINNAFQALDNKKDGKVTIQTEKLTDSIRISIIDNGKGIPDAIKNKIFQPFFTTKATGQGTGLGLSLAYDIVNSYGGEIVVNSTLDSGTEFIILLPTELME